MLIVKVSHEEDARSYYEDDGSIDSSVMLPITISRSEIEILRSDYCETIIQPPITENDLALLRRHSVEFELEDLILQFEEEVLI